MAVLERIAFKNCFTFTAEDCERVFSLMKSAMLKRWNYIFKEALFYTLAVHVRRTEKMIHMIFSISFYSF
jgi:hypothetical protein